MIRRICVVSALSLLLAVPASAAVIDFSGNGTTGSITVDGTGNDASGTGITITGFSYSDTPSGSGSLSIVGGLISFDTGIGSNFLTITGGVDLNNNSNTTDPGDIPNGSVLFSGSWTTSSYSTFSGGLGVEVEGTGVNLINNTLETFLGLSPATSWAYFVLNISVFDPSGPSSNVFQAGTTSTDIVTVSAVPEPGSMILLGSGLLGLAGAARRRMRRK